MQPLLARFKERKLAQWALAYLAGAWLLLQVLNLLSEIFHWPDVAQQTAAILLGVGFLAALVLAWYHGERGEQKATTVELVMLSGILVVAGAAVSLISGAQPHTAAEPTRTAVTAPAGRKALAVLPFVNLSSEAENAYFASAIHDELLTQLGKLGDLKVISRTSVQQYANTTKPIRQIAAELGVGTVLEGSVQRAGNRVRVAAQLIDAATDEHLWAEKYDRNLTDVFAIQSDIARQIASALEAKLTAGERATLEWRPTENTGAYTLYLQAREYHNRPDPTQESLRTAVGLYERAIALDPGFALAHAWLSYAHGEVRWWKYDLSDARREKERKEAERALQLQPDLPEAHFAMGTYYYWGLRNYDRALREMDIAHRGAPNDADVLHFIGAIHRRQGDLDEGAREMEQSLALDPRNTLFASDLADMYYLLRRYPEAERTLNQALELAPDSYDAASLKGSVYVTWKGTVDTLRAAADRFPVSQSATQSPAFDRFLAAWLSRDYPRALRAAEAAPEVIALPARYYPSALLIGWARQRQGDVAGARTAFERAHRTLEAALREHPEDERIHIALGYALAGLGRRGEAEGEIRRADEILPLSLDEYIGLFNAQEYAAIRAQAGDADGAIAGLEQLLRGPSYLSANNLRLDPIWDPIRRDPRFQRLMRGE
ncbi:MAG TPA: tetratricopeptide repeat protein [Longimicrobiaceae bacterium]|nr:tetratricopeptide repeat protein [Longimicrobiaceae bacterium]